MRKSGATRTKNYELLIQHFKTACEPFYFNKTCLVTGEVQRKVKQLDMIDEDRSLMSLLQQFIKQSPKHIQEQEQAKAKEAKIEAKIKEYEATLEKQREANKT